MQYPTIIYPCEEGGFVAEILALKGCLTQGETPLECLNELEIVVNLWLETARETPEEIPDSEKVLQQLRKAMA